MAVNSLLGDIKSDIDCVHKGAQKQGSESSRIIEDVARCVLGVANSAAEAAAAAYRSQNRRKSKLIAAAAAAAEAPAAAEAGQRLPTSLFLKIEPYLVKGDKDNLFSCSTGLDGALITSLLGKRTTAGEEAQREIISCETFQELFAIAANSSRSGEEFPSFLDRSSARTIECELRSGSSWGRGSRAHYEKMTPMVKKFFEWAKSIKEKRGAICPTMQRDGRFFILSCFLNGGEMVEMQPFLDDLHEIIMKANADGASVERSHEDRFVAFETCKADVLRRIREFAEEIGPEKARYYSKSLSDTIIEEMEARGLTFDLYRDHEGVVRAVERYSSRIAPDLQRGFKIELESALCNEGANNQATTVDQMFYEIGFLGNELKKLAQQMHNYASVADSKMAALLQKFSKLYRCDDAEISLEEKEAICGELRLLIQSAKQHGCTYDSKIVNLMVGVAQSMRGIVVDCDFEKTISDIDPLFGALITTIRESRYPGKSRM